MLQIILKAATLTVLAYFLTLFLTRILGRKLISQMTFFDFVVGVVIGSAVVNAATVPQNQSLSGFITLIGVSMLTLIIDFAHIKSFFIQKLFGSEPVVVIENGKINNENMEKIRLTIEELMMKLRQKNAFTISNVEYAIMEIDGNLSVQLKSQKQPLTPSDMNLPTSYKGLTRDLIIDGNVMKDNLQYVNLNEQWLKDQIKGYGIQKITDVFYAGLDTAGNLYVSKRRTSTEVAGKHGIE